MKTNKKYKLSSDFKEYSDETAAIVDKIFSYKTFSSIESGLHDVLKRYDISADIFEVNEKLRGLSGGKRQTTTTISEIPPEGILIDTPGEYKIEPPSNNIITWSPSASVGAAITIIASGVVLDMGNCNLTAKIQDSSAHLVGIFVLGASKVAIKNGTLTNMCLYGVQAEFVDKLVVDNINISGLEYNNTKIRNACPSGIHVNYAKAVTISHCQLQYMYVSADVCAGIQLLNTISGKVTDCSVSNIINYAGGVEGFGYALSSKISTADCKADNLQSHFGQNIRTGGHTVLGFLPTLCYDLLFERCSATNIIGSCDDCHGMSVFVCAKVEVKSFKADKVTDGVSQFNSGAKATGLEVYGTDIKIHHCSVNHITAINPQDKQSAGFSVWGEGIEFLHCHANNVLVKNDLDGKDLMLGFGVGFGWAPDPRLYHTGAIKVTYKDCRANNCQVGFDTWNHIDSDWMNPSYSNCGINLLVEPGGVRTFFGDPCTECNPPVAIKVKNQAKNNHYPGADMHEPSMRYAYPTGNINGLSIPSALARLKEVDSQWWFYVGLLRDSGKNDHSFELTFIEPGGLIGESGITAVDFDFTFNCQGSEFHATSTFGGDEVLNVIQSASNVLGMATVSSAEKSYRIDVDSASGPKVVVEYSADKSEPKGSMYTGQIGQPGGVYTIKGTGNTWLWKYPQTGEGMCAPYQYNISIELIDERGLVPEGIGSYVGIDPIHPPEKPKQSSVEYAQPRLRVKQWTIELTRNQECWPIAIWEDIEGFEEVYSHAGAGNDSGHIWLDRQALFDAPSYRQSATRSVLVEALSQIQHAFSPQQIADNLQTTHTKEQSSSLAHYLSKSTAKTASKQLYLGCWLPVILTEGPYEGATLLFVAFWNKAKSIANYDTDVDAHWNSFMNLYTGFIDSDFYDALSAYTLSDFLDPAMGQLNTPSLSNNYRIHFTQQFDNIGGMLDPQRWASEIEVTIKAHTQARYALSAYARRANRTESHGVDHDLTFTIKAVSPYTNTTMLSSELGAPIYEGASQVFNQEGEPVGMGWIEQMVGDPAKAKLIV